MNYEEYWDRLYQTGDELNSLFHHYWSVYSSFDSWQFWVVLILTVGPLILLIFTVDRSRVFELFFLGYSIHLLWTYIDVPLERYGYFVHKYFFVPIYPYSLNMTAAVLPVSFLLLYQYCTSRKKDFFVYSALMSAVFSFVFAPLESVIGLLELRKGMNYAYLLLIDLAVVYFCYIFTRVLKGVMERNQ
ncbi:hypothetical protein FZC78_03605 [Rossellomorea vietnamensis]|uniref:Uncharacterized protein n=1 Tax=Rossellomorea vietnamensis TaxID=218284 RepID=A0A5D4P1H2_9BACI|nr:hypothetical protein [Rossellomorea vietnamensis]TYS18622.1 hypothetical protein FZC78_03605 [Rossellomorea vietnamensis]